MPYQHSPAQYRSIQLNLCPYRACIGNARLARCTGSTTRYVSTALGIAPEGLGSRGLGSTAFRITPYAMSAPDMGYQPPRELRIGAQQHHTMCHTTHRYHEQHLSTGHAIGAA
eukprot:262416-Rhodomonas_salina.1